MDEWYIHTHIPIKKSKTMLFAEKWEELEIIMLSEIIQTQKDKYHMFSLICEI
jgi:hypothetical protein